MQSLPDLDRGGMFLFMEEKLTFDASLGPDKNKTNNQKQLGILLILNRHPITETDPVDPDIVSI